MCLLLIHPVGCPYCRMQLLAEFEHSGEVLTWDENVYGEALLDHVRQLFQIAASNSILLQKFDKERDEWINLKFDDVPLMTEPN